MRIKLILVTYTQLIEAGDNSSTEGGVSIAYGSDYSIFDKEKSSEIFNFKVANNFRFEKNDDLPEKIK